MTNPCAEVEIYDHNHFLCAKLACPRCGWEPQTGKYVVSFPNDRYSCSMCEECWMTYQADMAPEDRDPFVIEEMTL